MNPTIRYLARQVQERRVVLFVGAGLSVEAGLPDGRTLLGRLAAEIDHTPDADETLGMIAEYYDRYFPGTLIDSLRDWLYDTGQPGLSHEIIARLPWRAVFTTNYDTLLEQAFAAAGTPYARLLYNAQLLDLPAAGGTPIVKLHGCLSPEYRRSSEAPLVITDQDYEQFGPRRQALIGYLRQIIVEGGVVLFVGYSLRDRFWLDLRQDIADSLQQHARSYYAVLPYFSDHRADYWRARNVQLLRYTAADFFSLLDAATS